MPIKFRRGKKKFCFNWEKAQQMPRVDVEGKLKKKEKEKDIELYTYLLVYMIKHLVSSNDWLSIKEKVGFAL